MKEKILIALSDPSLTRSISLDLTNQGYSVVTTQDGTDALMRMKNDSPDLVLIDLILQGKNGYDVLTEKSLDRLITKIPLIIVSNSGAPVDMKRLPSTASVKDYVIKTHVEPDDVLEKIAKVFGRPFTAHTHETPKPDKKDIKILWVEDDKFLNQILSKKFESSNISALRAQNSDEAFAILQTEVPQAIILDISLPGMNGLEILQKIRMNESLRKVPVMMLSNTSKASDIEKAKVLGAQKFLVKAAVSLDEIVKEIRLLVQS